MKKRFSVLYSLVFAVLCAGTLHADIFVRDARANVIYQYSNGVMFEGHARQNKKVFKYDPRLKAITRADGRVIATWKDNALWKNGRKWYIMEGRKVRHNQKIVAFIDGRKIYRGNGPGGKLVLYPDAPLPDPVAVYLFHVKVGETASGKSDNGEGKVTVDFSKVPYGYYLGAPKQGELVLSLRGNTIYYGGDLKVVAYTRRGLCFYKAGNTGLPDFCMDNKGTLYRGSERTPQNEVMHLEWFNCYAPGKHGAEAIGTLQYRGQNILTEGYTAPSQKPDFTGRRILLSSTLPNDRVDMAIRIFLVYLTQLAPEFRARMGK